MANFDQNITIDLNVNTETFNSQLAAAAGKIEGVQKTLEGLDSDFDEAAQSFENFSEIAEEDIKLNVDIDGIEGETDNIRSEMEVFKEFADVLDRVSESKNEVVDSNENLDGANLKTSESASKEAQSFEEVISSAENLTDVKNSTRKANKYLSNANLETAKTAIKESDSFETLEQQLQAMQILDKISEKNSILSDKNEDTAETAEVEAQSLSEVVSSAENLTDVKNSVSKANEYLSDNNLETAKTAIKESDSFETMHEKLQAMQILDDIAESNKKLGDEAENSAGSIDMETRSVEEMLEGAESLEGAKHAVANANQRVQNESGKSTKELLREKVAAGELDEKVLDLADSNDGLSESSKRARDSLKRLRETTDRSTSSMKAASDASDLFEDGIGALSVNIGAFTIALRNFLTQIPLLLTGLGAIASAAIGGASAFAVLGGAISGAVGAGFVAYAQQLVEEVESIENIGQAIQVIFSAIVDLFEKAAAPLLKLGNITFYLRWAVEGLATGIHMLSSAISDLLVGGENLQKFADAVGEDLFTINDAIESFDGSSWRNITESLMEAWVLLGEEVTWALGAINNAIARSIRRSAELLNGVEDLGGVINKFSDTLSELAELGFTIGSGLLPVFAMFTEIVGDAAAFINSLDKEVVSGIITLATLSIVISKVSGGLSSIVNVAPNVAGAFLRVSNTASKADTSFGKFKTTIKGLTSNFASFLNSIGAFGGISSLITSMTSLDDATRAVGFSTTKNNAMFKALAANVDHSADELKDLAVQSKLTASQIDYLTEELEELDKGEREIALRNVLTDEEFDALPDDKIPKLNVDGTLDPTDFDEGAEDVMMSIEKINNAGKFSPVDADEMNAANRVMNNLTGSMQKVATATGAATVPTSLYTAATQALNIASIKAAISQGKFLTALKRAGTQLAVATIQTFSYIAAQLGIIPSALSAAGATAVLDVALSSLTGGLTKIIPIALGLIAVLGGLAVGMSKNSEAIMGSFSKMVGVVRKVLGAFASFAMDIFMAVWDAMKMLAAPLIGLFKPLVSAFSMLGGSAEEGTTVLGTLLNLIDMLAARFSFAIRIVGLLGKIVITALVLPIRILMEALGFIIKGLISLTNATINFISKTDAFKAFFGNSASEANGLLDMINIIIDAIKAFPQTTEDMVNSFINDINVMIEKFNDFLDRINIFSGLGFEAELETLEKVKLARDEATSTSEAEVDSGTSPEFNMNVDKSTNIDQTVNADPEDKAQISRIAKDAIREANSFGRRTQGSQ